jgi:hypothetical protein
METGENSMTEYTLDEQIAALRKLGAIEADINVPCRCCDGTGRFPNGSECGYCEHGYSIATVPGWILSVDSTAIYYQSELEDMHDHLRTDPHGWMAMDEAMAKCGKMTILARGNRNQSDYQYNVQGVCAIEAATRQAAVYSVFMQFIREELKK